MRAYIKIHAGKQENEDYVDTPLLYLTNLLNLPPTLTQRS